MRELITLWAAPPAGSTPEELKYGVEEFAKLCNAEAVTFGKGGYALVGNKYAKAAYEKLKIKLDEHMKKTEGAST